jgi:hypothetical protein
MSQDFWAIASPVHRVQLAVADTTGELLDQNLVGARRRQCHRMDTEGSSLFWDDYNPCFNCHVTLLKTLNNPERLRPGPISPDARPHPNSRAAPSDAFIKTSRSRRWLQRNCHLHNLALFWRMIAPATSGHEPAHGLHHGFITIAISITIAITLAIKWLC